MNTGTGISTTASSTYRLPEAWCGDLADVNGDGLPDCIIAYLFNKKTFLNTGNGWVQDTSGKYISPALFYNYDYTVHDLHLIDVNGDGLTDVIDATEYGRPVYLRKGTTKKHLLTKVTTPLGESTSVTYSPSKKFVDIVNDGVTDKPIYNSNHSYPYISNLSSRYLVQTVTTTDGRATSGDGGVHTYTTDYSYNNGMTYSGYPYERTDLYFEKVVSKSRETGALTKTYYIQDNRYLAGKPRNYKEYAGNGSLLKNVDYNYTAEDKYGGKTKFVRLNSTQTSIYEMGNLVYSKTVSNDYDNYGNIIIITDGIDTSDDQITTQMTYSVDETDWIINRLTELQKTSQGGIYQWQQFIYNGNIIEAINEYYSEENRWISTGFEYDNYGNLVTITDPLGHESSIVYDGDYHTFPAAITNAKGQVIETEYDPATGNMLSVTDPNGNKTSYEYDEHKRLYMVIEPGDDWTKRLTYANLGTPASQYILTEINDSCAKDDDRIFWQKSFFDGMGREYKQVSKAYEKNTAKLSTVVDKIYDGWGNIQKQSNPYLQDDSGSPAEDIYYTVYSYDSSGRLNNTAYPDGTASGISYTNSGIYKAVIMTDQKNIKHRSEFDPRNRLVRKVEAVGDIDAAITYTYDPVGRLISTVDAGLAETTIQYDSLGRKIYMKDPNQGEWTYSYDDLGRLISQTDAMVNTTTFSYNEINQLISKEMPDDIFPGLTRTMEYKYGGDSGLGFTITNGTGRLAYVDDGVSVTRFNYDVKGNTSRWSQSIDDMTFVFKMKYDVRNRLANLVYPDGESIDRHYADAGYLEKVTTDDNLVVAYGRFELDESGNIESIENKIYRKTGNGVKTEITYNPLNNRPETVKTGLSSTYDEYENHDYTFDELGNILSITDNLNTGASQAFIYDALSRLKTANGIYGSLEYNFNVNGNLTQIGGKTLTYGYTATHPHAVSDDTIGKHYVYDANGNMTERGNDRLRYDSDNQLVSYC